MLTSISFGPVPSRRLGSSLGVNNIPSKYCTYSCVYCQVGRTVNLTLQRREFYESSEIYRDVEKRMSELEKYEIKIDYITFVPDGEPTLDRNLGNSIRSLRELSIPIAVLTNGSLLWREDVRGDLMNADLVSIKVDAVNEAIWRKINRPHPGLQLDRILGGIKRFTEEFEGAVITETMVIDGIDYREEAHHIADFLGVLRIRRAYISIPTRPPAERWVKQPTSRTLREIHNAFYSVLGGKTEYLTAYEGDKFVLVEDVEEEILGILSVHPVDERTLRSLLKRKNVDFDIIHKLKEEGEVMEITYGGRKFYRRRIKD